ncbi:MAG: hypothetical protein J1E36_02235 [Eubacterium sp.]|nr:hypothetical protein [Eubacterium sp.]
MRNKKIKKIFYFIVSMEIAIIFAIKIILDNLQKSFATSISNMFFTKIVISSILISLTFFIIFICFQFRIENEPTALSCIYNSTTRCCLYNSISLQNYFKLNNETITDIELARYERNVETKEIWLLSIDLSVEEGVNVFKEVVKSRLFEGVKYSFIALDTPISRERAKKIKNQYKSFLTNKKMHFYLLKSSDYDLFLSLYAVAIYNPTSNNENTQAYVCIGETNGSETSIYAKLNESHTQYATNITREIINKTEEYIP